MILLPLLLLLAACDAPPTAAPRPDDWPFAERLELVVTVEDDEGAPIPGAWVTLRPDGRDALTGADGVARFEGLAPGPRVAVVAATGFVTAERDVVDGLAVVLARPEPPSVHGRVTDPYGAPVAGAAVRVDGLDAITASDGTYVVEDLLAGPHVLTFTATALGPWSARVDVPDQGDVRVDAALPGRTPSAAVYVGSTSCLFCHGGADAGQAWLGSAHARAARTPAQLGGTALADAFTSQEVVPLGLGATLLLDATNGWTAELVDADNTSTGPLPVVEVYGGHRHGAAIAVDAGGERALLPALWALPDGWVVDRLDGWLADGRLTAPGVEVSFDLQCAGCHATGHRLVEGDGFALAPVAPRGEVEPRVGCEACHGPGSEHIARPSRARTTIHNPGRVAPADALQTCARCHERVETGDHPFSASPAWPILPSGEAVPPGVHGGVTPAPDRWAAAPGSRVRADQVGELRLSPHRRDGGWAGRCEDCHDAHGAELRQPGNQLCTGCHQSRFPSGVSERAHAGHALGSGASCVGCHMPRSGHEVRPDALSGAGELRSHALWPFHPSEVLSELDLAGVDALPPHRLPVGGCVDCHLQVGQGPAGDPGARATWEQLLPIYDGLWP